MKTTRLRELAGKLRDFLARNTLSLAHTDFIAIKQSAAALDELDASKARIVEGWQDIATAPKDGTWFQGWRPAASTEDTIDIWHWDATVATDGDYGFWINAADSNYDEHPTHWRPLPPPPHGASQ